MSAAVRTLTEPEDNSAEVTALFRNIQDLVRQAVQYLDTIPEDMANLLINTVEPVKLAYLIATVLNIDTQQEIELLMTDNLRPLLEQIAEHLSREVQILSLRRKIAGETQVELDKAQREYVLRQQLSRSRRSWEKTRIRTTWTSCVNGWRKPICRMRCARNSNASCLGYSA